MFAKLERSMVYVSTFPTKGEGKISVHGAKRERPLLRNPFDQFKRPEFQGRNWS